jgi:hypothetical protein
MMKKQHFAFGLMLALLPTLGGAFTGETQTSQKLASIIVATDTAHQGMQPERFVFNDGSSEITLAANEIYHWIDENGVANFSQQAPADHVPDVNTINLPDSDPGTSAMDEDPFNVAGRNG